MSPARVITLGLLVHDGSIDMCFLGADRTTIANGWWHGFSLEICPLAAYIAVAKLSGIPYALNTPVELSVMGQVQV